MLVSFICHPSAVVGYAKASASEFAMLNGADASSSRLQRDGDSSSSSN